MGLGSAATVTLKQAREAAAKILMFVGGGGMVLAAVFKVVSLVMRNREIRNFKGHGGKARADRMARERDLKNGGMVR